MYLSKKAIRSCLCLCIFAFTRMKLVEDRKPDAPTEWRKKLPRMVQRLEDTVAAAAVAALGCLAPGDLEVFVRVHGCGAGGRGVAWVWVWVGECVLCMCVGVWGVSVCCVCVWVCEG